MSTPVAIADRVSYEITMPNGERTTILHPVHLEVCEGEQIGIIGRSGSGKTTFLSLLGLLSSPSSGDIIHGGVRTAALSDSERARLRLLHIGFVFQTYSLVPHLSIYENIALPLRYGPLVRRCEERSRVHELLERVGLSGRISDMPKALSGGEQQRVAIARSLVRSPRIMLADEPTGALDIETGENVLDLLTETSNSAGVALIVVTHDLEVVDRMQKVARMDHGSLSFLEQEHEFIRDSHNPAKGHGE